VVLQLGGLGKALTTPHHKNVSCYKIFKQEFKKPPVPEPSAILAELAIEKLKKVTNHQQLIKSQQKLLRQGV
jgi:hypothetical protein